LHGKRGALTPRFSAAKIFHFFELFFFGRARFGLAGLTKTKGNGERRGRKGNAEERRDEGGGGVFSLRSVFCGLG
jgi:hypothetical protein